MMLVIALSLIPAWYINRWLQKIIQPRRSFLQLMLYFIVCLALVFIYTFLVVTLIFKLFPVAKG